MKPEIAGVFEKASYVFHYDICTSTGLRIMLVRTAMNSAMIQACASTHARLCFNLQQSVLEQERKKIRILFMLVLWASCLPSCFNMLGLMSQ